MDLRLLSQVDFTLSCLPTPIVAYNVDGTENQKGTIWWKAVKDVRALLVSQY